MGIVSHTQIVAQSANFARNIGKSAIFLIEVRTFGQMA
jgi:hypothetical protein